MQGENSMTKAATPGKSRGLLHYLFFCWANNVWFGIAVLVAIFVYSSAGSAIPILRQHPFFDMTEMEWFHWWPFDLMITLLCIVMITVTLKQIPLKLVNAGVWTIHTGIITLCLGSMYYFGTKLEGDVPIYRRQASIQLPGNTEPISMVIRPGNHLSAKGSDGDYHFAVSQIFPNWTIASGDDTGKQAYMAWIDVRTPSGNYTRQLLAGYPQYTEDILPDRTRAKKTLGRQLVDDTLSMKLDYEPQTEFFLKDSAAIFVRNSDDQPWSERPVPDIPHFNDHIRSHDDIITTPNQKPVPLRPISLKALPENNTPDPLSKYDVRVTAYLRYARMIQQWTPGGSKLNPVVGLSLITGTSRNDLELVALDPNRSTTANGAVAFKWVDSLDQVDQLTQSPVDKIIFTVPDTDIELTVPFRAPDTDFIPITGTDFAYKIKNVIHDLPVSQGPREGQQVSVAMVDIKTPTGVISRFVATDPNTTRDVVEQGKLSPPSSVIDVRFITGNTARVTILAGPESVGNWILINQGDLIDKQEITIGQPIPVAQQTNLTVNFLITHPIDDSKPMIVPVHQRQRIRMPFFSLVRLEITHDDWTRSVWLPFNRYALPNNQYVIPRRINLQPTELTLPDGQHVQLLYSRQRHPLPNPVALESFELATHQGGFTGSLDTVSDFISQLRFKSEDGWSDPMQMSSNRPATNGGFWYFQSEWDKPSQGYNGMNFTGAGIGNRNGVYIQLAGTCIAVTGMLFAFYVKPVIRRKSQEKARLRRQQRQTPTNIEETEAAGVA